MDDIKDPHKRKKSPATAEAESGASLGRSAGTKTPAKYRGGSIRGFMTAAAAAEAHS